MSLTYTHFCLSIDTVKLAKEGITIFAALASTQTLENTFGSQPLDPTHETFCRSVIKEYGINQKPVVLRKPTMYASKLTGLTAFSLLNYVFIPEKYHFDELPQNETRSVLSHELVHHERKHSLKKFFFNFSITLGCTAAYAYCSKYVFPQSSSYQAHIARDATVLGLGLVGYALCQAYSRSLEREADIESALKFNNASDAIALFIREQLLFPQPKSPLPQSITQLFASHPHEEERIAYLQTIGNIDDTTLASLKEHISRDIKERQKTHNAALESYRSYIKEVAQQLGVFVKQPITSYIPEYLLESMPEAYYSGYICSGCEFLHISKKWLDTLSEPEKQFMIGRLFLYATLMNTLKKDHQGYYHALSVVELAAAIAAYIGITQATKGSISYVPRIVGSKIISDIVYHLVLRPLKQAKNTEIRSKICTSVAQKLQCIDGAIGALTKMKTALVTTMKSDPAYICKMCEKLDTYIKKLRLALPT